MELIDALRSPSIPRFDSLIAARDSLLAVRTMRCAGEALAKLALGA